MSSVCSIVLFLKLLRPTHYVCAGIAKRTITRVQQEASCSSISQHQKLQRNIEFWHDVYLLSMVILLSFCAFALLHAFLSYWRALLAIAVGHVVSSEVPAVVMHQDLGACYHSWSCWNMFETVKFFHFGQLSKDYEILLGLQVTSFSWQRWQVYVSGSFEWVEKWIYTS